MDVYIDTEFNSYRGALLSLALVDARGESLYFVLDRAGMEIDPWVQEHVIPVIGLQAPYEGGMPELQALLEWWLGRYDAVHLIADWPEDIEHFCRCLITGPGERIDTPPLTLEIRRDLDADSKIPHHALEDARAIRRKHLGLRDAA